MPLSTPIKTLLAVSPFVFSKKDRLLVCPTQIAFRMHLSEEIKPYLISAPCELGKYSELFRALGATESPTLDQFADVLRAVKERSNESVLDPNERCAVISAVREFFTIVKRSKSEIQLSNPDLNLPGHDWKMYKSSSLVFDNGYLGSRIHNFDQPFLISLKQCELELNVHETLQLIRKLPACTQPQLLSAIVNENLQSDFPASSSCSFSNGLEAKLRSEEFEQGLRRLAWHALCDEQANESIQSTVDNSLTGLQRIHIVGVDQLITVLSYRGETINGSEKSSSLFVVTSSENGSSHWKVYVCERNLRHKRIFFE
jgi:hypothetical protein